MGGVYRAVSHPSALTAGEERDIARLITAHLISALGSYTQKLKVGGAHHIGTVLDSASGMRLPRRVESTSMSLPVSMADR